MEDYFEELAYLFLIAFGIALFVKGFLPLFKVSIAKLPLPDGLKQAAAT